MKVRRRGTIDEMRSRLNETGQEKPSSQRELKLRQARLQLERTDRELRDSLAFPETGYHGPYGNEMDGMSDDEVAYFNACMDGFSMSADDNGDRILSNIKDYVRAKGYEYDTRNRFHADLIYYGSEYPLEAFYYTKGDEALALTATGYDWSCNYNHFRIEKRPIEELDRLKADPPRPSIVMSIQTERADFPLDSHVPDYDYESTPDWTDRALDSPWWELGKELPDMLSDAEVHASVSPAAQESFSSMGYRCLADLDHHQIMYLREHEHAHPYYTYATEIVFDLDSRNVSLDLDESHDFIDAKELEAISQQVDYLGWDRSKDLRNSADEEIRSRYSEAADHACGSYRSHRGRPVLLDLQSRTIRPGRGSCFVTLNADDIGAVSRIAGNLGWMKAQTPSKSLPTRSNDDFGIDI